MIKRNKGGRKTDEGEERIDNLEGVISYILIGGIILSMLLIGIGLITYYFPKELVVAHTLP